MKAYARHEHHDFVGASNQALADLPLQAALVRLTSTLMAGNRRGYANLADSDKLRDHAKRIKEHALAHLDQYLEQLEASVTRLGGHVHWAATAEEARQTVDTWIRTSHQFDAVLDFDAAVRDPANPRQINPIYDVGDHLHMTPAGYGQIAASIPFDLFQPDPPTRAS